LASLVFFKNRNTNLYMKYKKIKPSLDLTKHYTFRITPETQKNVQRLRNEFDISAWLRDKLKKHIKKLDLKLNKETQSQKSA
jgi:ABC-type enterochelin transport system substrate-binding protein